MGHLVLVATITMNGAWQAAYSETEENNPGVGGDFTLTDDRGHQWSLQSARGKAVLIFFGYTHCPDVCPLQLTTLATVIRQLGERAKRVQPLFITLDPERDRAEVLRTYVQYFGTNLIGLTGSTEDIKRVANRYHVTHQRRDPTQNGAYTLDHTASLYVVRPDGELATIVPFGFPPEHIVQIINSLLARD